MENNFLGFEDVGANPTFSNELTFDVCGKFVQVSLRDRGDWFYFDLNLAQLKELKEFVENTIKEAENECK